MFLTGFILGVAIGLWAGVLLCKRRIRAGQSMIGKDQADKRQSIGHDRGIEIFDD